MERGRICVSRNHENSKLWLTAIRMLIGGLLLFLLLLIQGGIRQCLADPGDFTIESGVLTAYSGTDKGVDVPSGVTKIGNGVFSGRSDIVSVTLPNTVTEIGNNAFEDCTSLTFINMPSNLKTIGSRAFYGCKQLIEVVMPNTVTSIGKEAFYRCDSLLSVKLSSGLKTTGTDTFKSCTGLIYVTVPSGVETIGEGTFDQCSKLLGVSLPDSVTSIERKAFAGCSDLLTMQIPKNVTAIADYTFCYKSYAVTCKKMYALQIPAGVTSIGSYAIPKYEDNHLQTIYYGGTKTQWEAITTSDEETETAKALAKAKVIYGKTMEDPVAPTITSGFARAGSLNSNDNGFTVVDGVLIAYNGPGGAITVPEGVTYIYPGVFQGNEDLTKVTLPTTLYGIGAQAFSNCINLTQVAIQGKTYYIGEKAFQFCSSLESINLPNGMFSLSPHVFSYCKKLQSITLPKTLVKIGVCAFEHCALTTLTVPENVLYFGADAVQYNEEMISCKLPDGIRVVGGMAFLHCDKLQELNFPESTKIIGGDVFSNCYDLTSVTLPEDLQQVEDSAFNWCSKLSELELPDGLKKIGYSAFSNSDLVRLSLPDGLDVIEENAFLKANKLAAIAIPGSVTQLGDKAFNTCTNLKTVYLPNSIDAIGENTFQGCSSLKNIYFQGSQADWEAKGGPAALANAPAAADGSKPKVTFNSNPSNIPALTVYRINYDLQADGLKTDNPTTYTPADADFTLINPTRNSYNFLGWVSSQNPDDPKTEVTIHCADGGDKHFTVKWERFYTITHTLNEGTLPSGTSNRKTYTENDEDFELVNPTRANYKFLGWTGSNGDVPQEKVKVIVSEGENRNYVAKWTRKYTIKYNLDGGKAPAGTTYPTTYTEKDPDISIPDPVKENAVFLGWYVTDQSVDLVKDYVIPKGTTGNITLSAVWEGGKYDEDVYNITYVLNGGKAEGNPDSYTSDDPDIHISRPQKEDSYFAYWNISGGYVAGTDRDPIIPHGCRGDLKFVAIFYECDHTVVFLPEKEPTCTEPGYKEGTGCLCGKVSYPGETIPALGHDYDYDNGVVTKQATETEPGVIVYTCKRCKAKKEEVIPAGGSGQGGGNGQGSGNGQGGIGNGQDGSGTVSGNTPGNGTGTGTGTGSESGDTAGQGQVGKIGLVFTKGKGVYKITKRGKKPEVTYLRPAGKKKASASIPATVKYKGVTYRVTAIGSKAFSKWKKKLKKVTIGKNVKKIGKEAFKNCKKLKTVIIKTTKLKKKAVGKNAFKGIHTKAKAKVPKKKLGAYKAILKKAGIKGKKQKIVKG
ncbi:MAG: leucine-rich repeat protein [Lachnospiraceae bacterium]|nr:leucine-rich repeat protein [Lachnospiraceae bacterium]